MILGRDKGVSNSPIERKVVPQCRSMNKVRVFDAVGVQKSSSQLQFVHTPTGI